MRRSNAVCVANEVLNAVCPLALTRKRRPAASLKFLLASILMLAFVTFPAWAEETSKEASTQQQPDLESTNLAPDQAETSRATTEDADTSPEKPVAEKTWVITGQVQEKGTRRPLSNATVFVVEQDSIYATSDFNGEFELKISAPGQYTISAVAMGFEKARRPPKIKLDTTVLKSKHLTLYLLPSATLPVVTVEENRNEDRIGKTVISGKELEQVAGSGGDPVKAVQSLPGVTTNHDGSANPAIRGSRPGDNIYYMDDIELGYLFHMGGFVSIFPADLVSDFNIFASSFGPEYGDVIGAAFDVAIRNPRNDRLGGKVNISLVSSDILVEGPVAENQSLLFSARRSYWDLLLGEQETDDGVTFQFPNYYDYLTKYVWDMSAKDRLTVYVNGAGDELEFHVPDSSEPAEKEPVLAGSSDIDTSFNNQSIIWESKLGANSTDQLIFGHRNTRQETRIGTAFDISTKNDMLYLKETVKFQPFADHKISLGGDYARIDVDIYADGVNPLCTEFDLNQCRYSIAQRVTLDSGFVVNAWDLFLKDRWSIMQDVTLVLGVRHSTEDYLHNDFTEPRLGLEWEYSKNGVFTLGWGKYHQFPDGRYVLDNIGNRDLDSIRAEHSLMGIEHDLDATWSVKSELYYKTFTGFIIGDVAQQTYINGASGKSFGWELFVKRNSQEKLSGWLSLTLSRSERTIDATGQNFPFDYDQPVIATWVANYKMSNAWHFGLKWRYHTGARYTPIIGTSIDDSTGQTIYYPNYGATNSERLPAYHRLDIRFDRDYVFNTWKFNTYFEVVNVYNRCNVSGYSYDAQYTEASKEETCQMPFLPFFGLQAEF